MKSDIYHIIGLKCCWSSQFRHLNPYSLKCVLLTLQQTPTQVCPSLFGSTSALKPFHDNITTEKLLKTGIFKLS